MIETNFGTYGIWVGVSDVNSRDIVFVENRDVQELIKELTKYEKTIDSDKPKDVDAVLELDTQYAQDVFEYLCEAPMEFTSPLDPPESRNPGIEQLISQLNVIIENKNEIEQMEV